jgi:carbonic anhydrase
MSSGDVVDNAAREHVRRTKAEGVRQSMCLREAVERQRLTVVGAFYDLSSGLVEIL